MSIVPMRRVSVVGAASVKDAVLRELQQAGFFHVVAWGSGDGTEVGGLRQEATEALRYIQSSPIQRRPVRRADMDISDVERRALALKAEQARLSDERDRLLAKRQALEPWGEFELPFLGALGQGPAGPNRLWFYEVPTFRLDRIPPNRVWQEVARRAGVAYVVVISDEEPDDMPVARVRAGAWPLSEVRRRLDELEESLEDAQFRRAELTRYRELFEAELDALLDRQARCEVAAQTLDDGPVFALTGWVPKPREPELEAVAKRHACALWSRAPRPGDEPPTLLENRGLGRAGQSLVTFYVTPGYFDWDPSWAVVASFSIFFAMIMSDAGYALLLGALLGLYWRPAKRTFGTPLRSAFAFTLALSAAWGVLVGSYFGVEPGSDGMLANLRLFRIDDYDAMMRVSVGVGALHVVAANLAKAVWVRGAGALGAVGWSVAIITGVGWWWVSDDPVLSAHVGAAAPWVWGASALLILGFTAPAGGLGRRVLAGARSLSQVTAAFGDVLSYLRLFALGLASSSLALAFNDLAERAGQTEGIGLLLALGVLVVGHGINIGLAIMSGFVHGLRLNFIEFFRWGTTSEGRPFRAFALRRRASEPSEG